MFKKIAESMEKASVRAALKEGTLVCPDCGARAGDLPPEWDQLMKCGECGARAPLPEWVANDGIVRGRADLPPAFTKIRREEDGSGGTIWHVPASGKVGFLLVFGILWLGFTFLLTVNVIREYIRVIWNGNEMPDHTLGLFLLVFNAAGLVMLWFGLRQKFLRHRLTASGGGVTLASEMLGREKESSLQPGSVTSVAQKEFYRQNYQPVYGIEIRGDGGKLRFGSVLTQDEKAWLVADISETLFGRKDGGFKASGSAHAPVGREEVFSIALPDPPKSIWIGSLVFTLVSIGFMCFGIFGMEGDPLPKNGGGVAGFLDLILSFFTDSFRAIWLIMTTVFVGLGIFTLLRNLSAAVGDTRLEGNSAEISLRTYKRGLIVKDRSFPRDSVSGIRATANGSSDRNSWKRVTLHAGGRSEKISTWLDGGEADRFIAEARALLGCDLRSR